MAKSYCYITKKKGGMYIDCSYDKDFLDTFKRLIPIPEREWNPDIYQWWVTKKYAAQAERCCRDFYENVIEC